MNKELINLIEKAQNRTDSGQFKLVPDNKSKKEIVYDEDDLTKSYVKFTTDVLSEKYGTVTEKVIHAFGHSLKTSVEKFKPSYREKKSAIKEILPSVFIHTSMDSNTMKLHIIRIAESIKFFPKFPLEEQK
jgi:hypothetical protein